MSTHIQELLNLEGEEYGQPYSEIYMKLYQLGYTLVSESFSAPEIVIEGGRTFIKHHFNTTFWLYTGHYTTR